MLCSGTLLSCLCLKVQRCGSQHLQYPPVPRSARNFKTDINSLPTERVRPVQQESTCTLLRRHGGSSPQAQTDQADLAAQDVAKLRSQQRQKWRMRIAKLFLLSMCRISRRGTHRTCHVGPSSHVFASDLLVQQHQQPHNPIEGLPVQILRAPQSA